MTLPDDQDSAAFAVDPGSFRDPSGFVFRRGGTIYRQVNREYRETFELATRSGLLDRLIRDGLLIPHREVAAAPAEPSIADRVLEPEPIPFVSYPYEWCFGQLRAAALATLRIQKRALEHGLSLKDASAFNIQFVGFRPVLIDTLSFEPYREGRPWSAYRQFCRHFLAPLALRSRLGAIAGRLSQAFIDGLPLELVSATLPWQSWLRPSLLVHLHLHARATGSPGGGRPSAAFSLKAMHGLVEALAAAIDSQHLQLAASVWSEYDDTTSYTADGAEAKRAKVAEWLRQMSPTMVWDLGANRGSFSRVAAEAGGYTVAFDADPTTVEMHDRRCRSDKSIRILPLEMDFANPSPGLGWAGEERRSLAERGPADTLLALALVHHLAIGNNVPLPRIARELARLGRSAIVEFVPKRDPMVQRLLESRTDIFGDYHREGFERAFAAAFSIDSTQALPDSERILYRLTRR